MTQIGGRVWLSTSPASDRAYWPRQRGQVAPLVRIQKGHPRSRTLSHYSPRSGYAYSTSTSDTARILRAAARRPRIHWPNMVWTTTRRALIRQLTWDRQHQMVPLGTI